MQEPKINKNSKNSTQNNHYSQVVVFFLFSLSFMHIKIRSYERIYIFHFGGAAGNCRRVQKVTNYPSTSLVFLRIFTT